MLRENRGLSQKELAAALGVHPMHLSKVELGTRTSVSLIQRAKRILLR